MYELYQWETVAAEQMNPQVSRQVIHSDNMTLSRLSLKKGAFVPVHSHVAEQVCFVHAGQLQFVLDGQEQVVDAGQILRIPPNVPHSAEALEDSIALDLFSPRREDWIRGDDAYLRR
jgi:quercetin dioxygenase-like cupin family protein